MKVTYQGDANLEKLLKAAGETRSLAEIKDIIKGVLAAPQNAALPDLWLTLFRIDAAAEAAGQLTALKQHMAEHKETFHQDKLADMRAEMKTRGISGFFVTRTDEYNGEYVPECAERLAWITGFTGSAGEAVVLNDKAGFFTDGRYTLQSRTQVNAASFGIYNLSPHQDPIPTMRPTEWIEKNLAKGSTFGIDPWLHSVDSAKEIRDAVEKAGGKLVHIDSNPLDAAWKGRPATPLSPVVPHPLQYAGKASEAKRRDIAGILNDKSADALVITFPEEICWLLNIRGGDVPCTPFALSYAIAHKDGTVDWFIDNRKLTDETRKWTGADVRIHDIAAFKDNLAALAKQGKTIWINPRTAPIAAQAIVNDNGGRAYNERSPIQLLKALKNDVELKGMIACHIRDGAALTRFMAAISEPGAAAKLDEIAASDLLYGLRAKNDLFRGLSFDTISGAGAHGAIIHYRSTPETSKPLTYGPVYLVDSGAQYLDGTTDVTRTLAVATPSAEMKENFTRVLKGHIAVAAAEFAEGECGDKLDEKARASLKEAGLDYAHGTGHGVGSHLSVHEGPCSISTRSKTPLEPSMIVSNEPGYYKEGSYGIRIENLVTVIDTGKKDKDGKRLFGFKTLTMAPIDRNMADPALLTADELAWLNNYHAEVQRNLTPLLKNDPQALAWLEKAAAPIQKTAA